jgi:hypothetical protein
MEKQGHKVIIVGAGIALAQAKLGEHIANAQAILTVSILVLRRISLPQTEHDVIQALTLLFLQPRKHGIVIFRNPPHWEVSQFLGN